MLPPTVTITEQDDSSILSAGMDHGGCPGAPSRSRQTLTRGTPRPAPHDTSHSQIPDKGSQSPDHPAAGHLALDCPTPTAKATGQPARGSSSPDKAPEQTARPAAPAQVAARRGPGWESDYSWKSGLRHVPELQWGWLHNRLIVWVAIMVSPKEGGGGRGREGVGEAKQEGREGVGEEKEQGGGGER